jgi:hypothetical protein
MCCPTYHFIRLSMLVALLCAPLQAADGKSSVTPRQRVKDAKSFYCYYGANRVEELAQYDLVILHTPAATKEVVNELKSRGVVTLGYITVGADLEVRKGNGKGPGGKASWYFDKDMNGQPDMDPIWKTPWANTADPEWRKFCVAEAKNLVNEHGFDGLFLDTTDNVTIYPEMFEGMVKLIEQFRLELPEAPIVMNQSWELLRRVAPVVDGVMLEGFTTSYDFANKRYRRNPVNWDDNGLAMMKKYVLPLRTQYPMQVVVLDYCEPQQTDLMQAAADRAASFGFLHCVAPVSLDDVYPKRVTAKPHAKYLERQATPESMSVTLDNSRNGFPAGTKVLPSGCFGGYSVAPVLDGREDRAGVDWSKTAWASAEDGAPAWVEFQLPKPMRQGKLEIEWETGHASRAFAVQTKATDDNWSVVMRLEKNNDQVSFVSLPDREFISIRIYQESGGGSEKRPNLMWISRVRLKGM